MSAKPLAIKHPKPKLAWPGYRELLNLDRQPTEKIESDDENENYLEKLLKKEREEQKKNEEDMRAQRKKFEQDRKNEERRKRMTEKLERKRMIEDGHIDPNDPANQLPEEEPSEESVLEPVQSTIVDSERPLATISQQSMREQQPIKQLCSRLLTKTTSKIHEKRCRSV